MTSRPIDPFLQSGLNHGLAAACLANAPDSVALLLQAGADPGAQSILDSCAAIGAVDCLRLLLEAGAAPLDSAMWMSASAPPDLEARCLSLLLAHGADPNAESRFLRACSMDRPLAMGVLISAGCHIPWNTPACPVASIAHSMLGRPAPGAFETLSVLLEMTRDLPEAPSQARMDSLNRGLRILAGSPALSSASPDAAARKAARILLSHGADPNTPGVGPSPSNSVLASALESDRMGLALELVLSGAHPSHLVSVGVKVTPPLFVAASRRDLALAQALLSAGADPNASIDQAASLSSALHCAAASYDQARDGDPVGAIVDALINAGADIEALNAESQTPLALGLSLFSRDPEFCLALVNAGANASAIVSKERSARALIQSLAVKPGNSPRWRAVRDALLAQDEKSALERHTRSPSDTHAPRLRAL